MGWNIYVHGIMDGETLAKDRNGTEARREEGVGPKETRPRTWHLGTNYTATA